MNKSLVVLIAVVLMAVVLCVGTACAADIQPIDVNALPILGAEKSTPPATPATMMSDRNAPAWAQESWNEGIAKGNIQGYPDETFRPNSPITRAEAYAFAHDVTDKEAQSRFFQVCYLWLGLALLFGLLFLFVALFSIRISDIKHAQESLDGDVQKLYSQLDGQATEAREMDKKLGEQARQVQELRAELATLRSDHGVLAQRLDERAGENIMVCETIAGLQSTLMLTVETFAKTGHYVHEQREMLSRYEARLDKVEHLADKSPLPEPTADKPVFAGEVIYYYDPGVPFDSMVSRRVPRVGEETEPVPEGYLLHQVRREIGKNADGEPGWVLVELFGKLPETAESAEDVISDPTKL